MMIIGSLFVAHANDYERANKAAKEAFSDLDCEFEDCHKEQPKPKVIVKEKIIEKPVVQKVIVEKPVIKEKVVYRDRVVYKEKPKEELNQPKPQEPKALGGLVYNKAFFDIHPKSQAPLLDYLKYSSRTSFDVEHFVESVKKIGERGLKVYVYGRLEVPNTIKTDEVYVTVGKNYRYDYYGYWRKFLYYNDSDTEQNSEYFLVKVKTDPSGRRYVKYKFYSLLDKPWDVKPSSKEIPSGIFKMAPKVRGFQDKFVPVRVYILDE